MRTSQSVPNAVREARLVSHELVVHTIVVVIVVAIFPRSILPPYSLNLLLRRPAYLSSRVYPLSRVVHIVLNV